MNKKASSKNTFNPRAPFKWVLMDVITATAPKRLTSETTFSSYLFIVDAYSKISKLYGMDRIITEDMMDKSDMFQSIFGKNRRILVVGYRNNFSRCRYTIYLHEVQGGTPNMWCSFEFISSGSSGNERTGQRDTVILQ